MKHNFEISPQAEVPINVMIQSSVTSLNTKRYQLGICTEMKPKKTVNTKH